MERSVALNPTILSLTDRTRTAKERGSALFLAIFALAAIGFVSLKLVLRTTAYSKLLQIHLDGLAHNAALRKSLQPIISQQHRCEVQRPSGHSIAGVATQGARWYVCTTGLPIFQSNHNTTPLNISPDYGAIFDSGTACPFSRSINRLRSFDTPTAPFTCFMPSVIHGDSIILDNIAAESTLVALGTLARTTLIATPGSLLVSASLGIQGDTLIVTGGNLKIPTLKFLPSRHTAPTAAVTVLSAHGDIFIEQIDGAVSLLAIGRRAIAVPLTNSPNSPPLPPMRAYSVAGFGPQ